MMPMFFIPIPFIFVLLILLLKQSPKKGAWVVGGLILFVVFVFMILLPLGMHKGWMPNAVPDGGEMPFFAIPIPFLFVLLVLLLRTSPKAGATVIFAVVVMALLGAGLWLRRSHGHAVYQQATIRLPESGGPVSSLSPIAQAAPTAPSVSSPIWSEGIEQEFEADIYPSRRAAVRALGRRIARPMREMLADANGPTEVVLFQEEHEQWLVTEFKKGLASLLPEVPCSLAAATRNVESTEIGVTLRFADLQALPSPWDRSGSSTILTSDVLASARSQNREATVRQHFVEKPWVEDFSSFVADKPDRHFLIARSWETCTDQNAARHQAMQDASRQLATSYEDLLEGDLVADQFVQSFDGISGPLWRHALLIDAAPDKLAWLTARKSAEVHSERVTWAHILASAFGVLVVIVVAYLFLNMATKGYYEWTLRIAGTVLAIAGIIAIFLVLR
ncbi:MAG: hypothetical protein GXY19_00595 [Phycisphaerae bacterium]|nr:hypothetical protein [Phycisphaerae bacterium]